VSTTALLFSGGIDSAAIAYWKRPAFAFTVDYGQTSARGEIRAAAQIAREIGIQHEVITVNCRQLGLGDLAGREPAPNAPASEWWPYRNQFLVTVAAMRAYALGIKRLLVGTVKSDEFHADGRAEFYHQLDALVAMQEGKIRIETPASKMTSVDLVRAAGIPLSLLGWTHSCHLDEFACGQCRGCCKHAQVFAEVQNGNAPIA